MRILQSYWRDGSRIPRIIGIEARAYFPILVALYHPRKWSFIAAGIAMLAFVVMEKKGYTLPVLLRAIRHWLRGTVVHARAWWHHRRNYE